MQPSQVILMLKPLCTVFLLALFTSIASAHQQKEAYITLLFNQSSGNLEVSHRFLIHDAEHIFAEIFDVKALNLTGDLLTDERTQVAFAAYIETHFALANSAKTPLPLNSVGYEVEGKYLWVYQETPIPNTESLLVKHSALHDLWPSQINHINVNINGQIRSLRLQKRDGTKWHSIALPKSKVE